MNKSMKQFGEQLEAKVAMSQLKDIEAMMAALPTNESIKEWKKSF
jgi:hypothetical protein